MKKTITIFLTLINVHVMAQNGFNLDSLFNWQDPSLQPSTVHFNTYNEVWGYANDGEEYAIIGTTAGTHIFDVTVPSASNEVVFIDADVTGPAVIHRDFHTLKDYLYIVCDEGASTLQIVDLQFLPDSAPVVYNSDALFSRSHNIFIDTASARMYVCGGATQFAVYSLANPTQPTLLLDCPVDVPFWSSIGYVHDVFVRGDTAYLNAGANGLFVVDFSNINSAQMIGSLDTYLQQGYNHSGWLMNNQPYYAMADETHGMDVKIVDVSDMNDLNVTDTIGSNVHQFSIPHNVVYKDNFLFIAHYFDGLYMFDCTDPARPTLAGFYDTSTEQQQVGVYRGCWGVYPFLPSGNILASDMQTGLWVFGSSLISGIEPVNEKPKLSVYPNPVTDRVYISVQLPNATYRIVDMLGKEVLAGVFDNSVVVSELPSGLYTFIIQNKDSKFNSRFIKL